MKLLAIQCRHHLLKNFQHACLKRTMIYTQRLSPHKPLSRIPTASFPLNPMAELSTTNNSTRTVTSSVSPPQGQKKDTFGGPFINFESPAIQFGILAGTFLRHKAQSLGFRVLPDGFIRVNEIVIFFFLTIFEPVVS